MPTTRATFNDCPNVVCGVDIARYRALTVAAVGEVITASLAASDAAFIGVSLSSEAANETVNYKPAVPGTQLVGTAAKAVTKGDTLFTATGGKLTNTDPGSGTPRGIAVTSTTGDGEEIGFIVL